MKRKKMLYEDLPVYEIIVEDDDNTGMKFISIVENPAIQTKAAAFAGRKRYDLQPAEYESHWHTHPNCKCSFLDGVWTTEPTPDGKYPCDICLETKDRYENWYRKRGGGESAAPGAKNFSFSINKDQQILAGPTMIPNKKIYRKDGDMEYYVTFSPETIKKIVQKFMRENNNKSINLEHSNTMVPAYIQEHWIVEDPVYDKSKLYGFDLPAGSHFACIKIEDENFWNTEVKQMGKMGFSIEGILGQKLMYMSDEFGPDKIEPGNQKISFDFHGVLNTPAGKRIAKNYINKGYKVYIVTNANETYSGDAINKVAEEVGISKNNIYYAKGDKVSVLNKLGIDKHYDNNPSVLKDIKENTETEAMKFSEEYEKIIDSFTEEDIKYIMDSFVYPSKGESEQDFISRCVSKVMNDGTTDDNKQAVAICYTYWENK